MKLSDAHIIAKGNRQNIFAHPSDPTLIIKVPQPGTFDTDGHLPRAGWFSRRFRRATMYRDFLREFREYIELKARYQEPDALLPICAVHGTVPSDLGLGFIYERISDPDGSLPPTLRELIDTKQMDAWHMSILDKFFDTLIAHDVIISNKNLKNIIFQTVRPGHGRFVWIDSFGSKQVLPIYKWSKWLNTLNLERKRRQIVGMAKEGTPRITEQSVSTGPDAKD